jgi:dTDP-glucose pyrophosphorylase/CBS domain-containing protein
MIKTGIDRFIIGQDCTIFETVEVIQDGHEGIALVVDEKRSLVATITDGDIRRAILSKIRMEDPISRLVDQRAEGLQEPITASLGTPKSELLSLMREKVLRQIPLLDAEGRVSDIALLNDLIEEIKQPLSAVVMAGGFGKRLRPLTADTPKPMLPFRGKPLMERTIEQLRSSGIDKICITTHHKADVITNHFGDGNGFGVAIEYVNEDTPMGTAGALGLIEKAEHTSLVINGDILTGLDFRKMLDYHHSHKSILTVGIRNFDIQIPYGVIDTEGVNIVGLAEKPDYSFFVNAGVYLLEPAAFDYIPDRAHFDMTDLIKVLIDTGETPVAFPIQEYWLDIGRPDDYEQAIKDAENGWL